MTENPLRVLTLPAFRNRPGNPYNALLYAAIEEFENVEVTEYNKHAALKQRFDILHIHWPERMYSSPGYLLAMIYSIYWILLITILKLRGTRLVWTAHNLREHDIRRPVLRRFMWFWFTRQVDGVLVLSESSKSSLLAEYPPLSKVPVFVTPHGHYRDSYPNEISKAEARIRLGYTGEDTVISFVGTVKPYKNALSLIRAFMEIHEPEFRLVVAGQVSEPALEKEIREVAQSDIRIMLNLEFIPDEDLQIFFRACDLIVFPYLSILNSGSAYMALSFDSPLLVPNMGSMQEIQTEFGAEWVLTYDGDLDADTLYRATVAVTNRDETKLTRPEFMSWQEIATATNQAYQAILSQEKNT